MFFSHSSTPFEYSSFFPTYLTLFAQRGKADTWPVFDWVDVDAHAGSVLIARRCQQGIECKSIRLFNWYNSSMMTSLLFSNILIHTWQGCWSSASCQQQPTWPWRYWAPPCGWARVDRPSPHYSSDHTCCLSVALQWLTEQRCYTIIVRQIWHLCVFSTTFTFS